MGRGPGRRQAEIQRWTWGSDDGYLLTHPGDTAARSSAMRRAAHRLEQHGRVVVRLELHEGRLRAVAYFPHGE